MSKSDKGNEILVAYVEFLTAASKNVAEVYAKTWHDATKLNEAVVKSTQDLYKDNPVYSSVSNLWSDYLSSSKK